jgi:hypothetical protein
MSKQSAKAVQNAAKQLITASKRPFSAILSVPQTSKNHFGCLTNSGAAHIFIVQIQAQRVSECAPIGMIDKRNSVELNQKVP